MTKDEQTFTCGACGKTEDAMVLPDGWVQIAVADPPHLEDTHLHVCSAACRRSYGKKDNKA